MNCFTKLFVLVLTPFVLLAQTIISGRITDANTGDPLAGANVMVAGTEIGTATDVEGNYKLSVPRTVGDEGEVVVRFIGYKTAKSTFALTEVEVTEDFQLSLDPLRMDAVIVTGVAGALTKATRPFVVDRIESDVLELVPSTSPEALIRGKAAGVKVIKGSGVPGTTASVQLRGATSINSSGRSQAPLFVVDNIIIDPSISGSPFSDIPPEDIESIEIVKGAAGSSTYGARAANGVITIKTKRGTGLGLGQTRFNFRSEFGNNDLIKKMTINRSHWFKVNEKDEFVDDDGNFLYPWKPRAPEAYSDSSWASGIYFADKPYKYVTTIPGVDPLTGDLPTDDTKLPLTELSGDGFDHFSRFFRPGTFRKNTFSMSQNAERYNLHFALSNHEEDGLFDFLKGFSRYSLRFNSDVRLADNLKVGLSSLVSKSHQDDMDQYTGSPFFDLLFFAPDVDLDMKEEDGSYVISVDPNNIEEANPLYQVREEKFFVERSRVLSGVTIDWDLTPQFRLDGSFSYDRSSRLNREYYPKGYKTPLPSPNFNRGNLEKQSYVEEALNATFGARYALRAGGLNFISRLRYTYEDDSYNFTEGQGWIFTVGDVPQLNVAQEQSIDSGNERVLAEGIVLGAQLDYEDKYILDLSYRRDGSSLFGEDEKWHNYPRFSAAYRVSEEPFWFLKDLLTEFKFRFSRGEAGVRPAFAAQYETWSVAAGAVQKGNLGNTELKPQHQIETELGLDMVLLDRVSIDLTKANAINEDQNLLVPLAGYYGYSNQWLNAGTMEVSSLEASVNAAVISSANLSLSLGAHYDKITQKITDFNLPPYLYAQSGTQDMKVFYMRDDEDYGAFYGAKWMTGTNQLPEGDDPSKFDINDDGFLVYVGDGNTWKDGIANTLWGLSAYHDQMGDTDLSADYGWGMPIKYTYVDEDGKTVSTHKLGSIVPDFSYALSANLRVGSLSVYALFDGAVGGQIYNMTNQWGARENKTGDIDQRGKSDAKKKPTEYYQTLYDARNPNSYYVEDGTYLKLRELSVRFALPLRMMGVDRITVGLVGRNLLTWTDYSGYDPEIGIPGGQLGSAVNSRFDSFVYPNYKTISGVLEIEF